MAINIRQNFDPDSRPNPRPEPKPQPKPNPRPQPQQRPQAPQDPRPNEITADDMRELFSWFESPETAENARQAASRIRPAKTAALPPKGTFKPKQPSDPQMQSLIKMAIMNAIAGAPRAEPLYGPEPLEPSSREREAWADRSRLDEIDMRDDMYGLSNEEMGSIPLRDIYGRLPWQSLMSGYEVGEPTPAHASLRDFEYGGPIWRQRLENMERRMAPYNPASNRMGAILRQNPAYLDDDIPF